MAKDLHYVWIFPSYRGVPSTISSKLFYKSLILPLLSESRSRFNGAAEGLSDSAHFMMKSLRVFTFLMMATTIALAAKLVAMLLASYKTTWVWVF